MDKRMKLTSDEVELVEAFRTEKNIWNAALAEAVSALEPFRDHQVYNPICTAILEKRK